MTSGFSEQGSFQIPPSSQPVSSATTACPPDTRAEDTLIEPAQAAQAPVRKATSPATSMNGHRARMRARLLENGPDALQDHEVLEMLLFLALPRRDTKPIARALLARFGSFAASIAAPNSQLLQITGLGQAGMAALKTVQAAALRLARAEILDKPILNAWSSLTDYLHIALAREKIEHVRVLYLDTRNRLLADEAQGSGTVNHTPVYPREIIKRALELNATALILVHNHPSGDCTPSREDITMTREIDQIAKMMGITLHDHVIVGNGQITSLRKLKKFG